MSGSDAGWLRWRSSGKPSGRPDSELYRGQRLATALEWLVDRPDRLTALETEFIAASEAAAGKADADRLGRSGGSACSCVALTATLLLAAVLGVVARSQRDDARVAATRPREPSSRPTSGPWAQLRWWSRGWIGHS